MDQKNMIYIGAGGAVLIVIIAGIAINAFGGKDSKTEQTVASSQNKVATQPPKILQQKKPVSVKQAQNNKNSKKEESEDSSSESSIDSDSSQASGSKPSQNSVAVNAKTKTKKNKDATEVDNNKSSKKKSKKQTTQQQEEQNNKEDNDKVSTKKKTKKSKKTKNTKEQVEQVNNEEEQKTGDEKSNKSSKKSSKNTKKNRPTANVNITINNTEFKTFEEQHSGLYSDIEELTRTMLEEQERIKEEKKIKPSNEEIKQKREDVKKFQTASVNYQKVTEKSKPELNDRFDKFREDLTSALNGVELNPQADSYVDKVIIAFDEHRSRVYEKKIENNQKNPFNPSDPGESYLNSSADLGIGCKFVDTKYQTELKEFISNSNKSKIQKIFQGLNPALINNLQLIPFSISSVEKTGEFLLQYSYANKLLDASEETKKYQAACFYSQNSQGFIFTPLNFKNQKSAQSLDHIKGKLQKSTCINSLMYRLIENKHQIAEVFTFANDLVKAGLSINKFGFKNLVLIPDYSSEEENVYLSRYYINDFSSLYNIKSPSEFEQYLNEKKKYTKSGNVDSQADKNNFVFSLIDMVRNMVIDSIPASVSYFKKVDSLKKVLTPLSSKLASRLNKDDSTKKQSQFTKKAIDQIIAQYSNSLLASQFSASAKVERFLNINISGEDSSDIILYIREFAAQYLGNFQKVTSVTVEKLQNRKGKEVTNKDAEFIQNLLMLSLQFNDSQNTEYQTYLESMNEQTLIELENYRII